MENNTLQPTLANIVTNRRDVRSHCCNSGVQIVYEKWDSIGGHQLVYSCNTCCNLYVVREDEYYFS